MPRLLLLALLSVSSALGFVRFASAQSDGTVRLAHVDYRDGRAGLRAMVELPSGRTLPVRVDADFDPSLYRLSGQRVTVSTRAISDGQSAAADLLATIRPNTFLVQQVSAQSPRFLVMLCGFSDGAPLDRSLYASAMSPTFPGADAFVATSSFQQSSLANSVVTTAVRLPQPSGYYFTGTNPFSTGSSGASDFLQRDRLLVNDCLSAVNSAGPQYALSDFDGVVLQVPVYLDASYAFSGPISITANGITKSLRLVVNGSWARAGIYAHEIGHTYGFRHTNTASEQPYASRWTVMSAAGSGFDAISQQSYGAMYSAVERTQAGWNASRVRTLPMNTRFTVPLTFVGLAPVSGDADAILATVQTSAGIDTILFEARQPRAGTFESGLTGEGVVIHRIRRSNSTPYIIDSDGNNDPNDAGGVWTVGETFEIPEVGLRLTVRERTATGMVVDADYTPPFKMVVDSVRRVPVGLPLLDTVRTLSPAGTAVFSATGLPAGVTFNATTRVLAGTPTASGIVRLRMQDGARVDSAAYRIELAPSPWVGGAVRVFAQSVLTVSDTLFDMGGPSNGFQQFSIGAEALPPGAQLTLSRSTTRQVLVARFTPSTVQTVNTKFSAYGAGGTAVQNVTYQVVASVLTIASAPTRPTAMEAEAYVDTLRTAGGSGAVSWAIQSGQLPGGFTLGTLTGIVSGAPADTGTFSAVVVASAGGNTATATLRYRVAPALSITSTPVRPRPALGLAYRDSLTAVGRITPIWRISVGALPPGLTLAASGVVSGMPTAAGSRVVEVQAVAGAIARAISLTYVVNLEPLVITSTAARPSSMEREPYADTLRVGGTTSAVTWRAVSGALPGGLSIDAPSGIVSGSPIDTGTFQVVIEAARDDDRTQASFSYRVESALAITSVTDRPRATVGVPFADTLRASARRAVVWTLRSGALPVGLQLTTAGIVQGSPATRGTYTAVIQATSGDVIRTATVQYVVNAAPIMITTLGLRAESFEGEAYGDTLRLAGSGGIASWRVATGSLPRGLSLAPATGIVAGAPLDTGLFSVAVEASRDGDVGTGTLSYRVRSALSITSSSSRPRGVVGTRITDTLRAVGRGVPTWRVLSGALPAGLTLGTSGIVSGTPAVRGTYSATVQALVGVVARTLVITYVVEAEPLRLSGDTLRLLQQAFAANDTVRTVGGDGTSVSWRIRSGTLPTGIQLANGVLTGVPTVAGDTRVELEARDASYVATTTIRVRVNSSVTSLPDSIRRPAAMGTAWADTLRAAAFGNAPLRWMATNMPRGLTLKEDGVMEGLADTTGTFRVVVQAIAIYPTQIASVSVPLVITINPPTITAAAVADRILSDAATLSPAQLRYLDQSGNNNGRLDVGDVVMWLQRQGIISARASISDALNILSTMTHKEP